VEVAGDRTAAELRRSLIQCDSTMGQKNRQCLGLATDTVVVGRERFRYFELLHGSYLTKAHVGWYRSGHRDLSAEHDFDSRPELWSRIVMENGQKGL
jgi:hypothetical protein